MESTIDMQTIRNINLFGRITKIRTRFCFRYNETVFFCVPMSFMAQAIGPAGKNIRQMHSILGKKVRVIAQPRGIEDAKRFILSIISPVQFKDMEIKDNEIIVSAGMQSKAALIGRNKRRLLEMQNIIKEFFGKDFRIV